MTDKGITGKQAEASLNAVGIVVNKNTVPNDKRSPFVTSGIRIGTCGMTTRGADESAMEVVAELIHACLQDIHSIETQVSVKRQCKIFACVIRYTRRQKNKCGARGVRKKKRR